ncbi:MAG: DUF3775 domain-containing protein [Acidiferrobacterales bacterium]
MFDVNPDTVCFLIDKAREFQGKEEVVLPDVPDSPSEDWGLQALADHAGDSTFQEFKTTFDNLEPDQQQNVVALFWVGRGDFDKSEWDQAFEEAQANWTESTAEYLLAHPLVADYLSEGLELFDFRCD